MNRNFEELVELPDFSGFKPASETAIFEAELALGLRFAPDYRNALLEYGCIETYGHELTGIIDSKRLNVVNATENMRSIHQEFKPDCYVIEDTYIDGIIICQNASGSVFQLDSSGDVRKIASSLIEYLSE